jgi:hypothetical protein
MGVYVHATECNQRELEAVDASYRIKPRDVLQAGRDRWLHLHRFTFSSHGL